QKGEKHYHDYECDVVEDYQKKCDPITFARCETNITHTNSSEFSEIEIIGENLVVRTTTKEYSLKRPHERANSHPLENGIGFISCKTDSFIRAGTKVEHCYGMQHIVMDLNNDVTAAERQMIEHFKEQKRADMERKEGIRKEREEANSSWIVRFFNRLIDFLFSSLFGRIILACLSIICLILVVSVIVYCKGISCLSGCIPQCGTCTTGR
ncbi:hypothetical protein PENTCL1PPCAC_24743, partial [Pristionchus entomophagus]